MAASTAFAVAGSAVVAPVREGLSSGNAFRTSMVQVAPVRSALKVNRVVAARASLSEDQESGTARREVLASILAAGAALSFSGPAFAENPVATAKGKASEVVQSAKGLTGIDPASVVGGKADEVVKGAKSVAGSNPLEKLTGSNPLDDVKGAADSAGAEVKRRIDGIFGKDKPYMAKQPISSGQGAIGDAKARVGSFFKKSQNPIAANVEKAAKETKAGLGSSTGEKSGSALAAKELLGQDSTRVDAATAKVKAGADNLRNKAVEAFEDATNVAGKVKDATPEVEAPKTGFFNSLGKGIEDVKGDLASKAGEVKGKVTDAVQ